MSDPIAVLPDEMPKILPRGSSALIQCCGNFIELHYNGGEGDGQFCQNCKALYELNDHRMVVEKVKD